MLENEAQIEQAARLLKTLGEPSRLKILRALWDAPKTVSQIIEATNMQQSNVSRQLAMLYDAGIVSRKKLGVQVQYTIALPIVHDLCAVVCQSTEQANELRRGDYRL